MPQYDFPARDKFREPINYDVPQQVVGTSASPKEREALKELIKNNPLMTGIHIEGQPVDFDWFRADSVNEIRLLTLWAPWYFLHKIPLVCCPYRGNEKLAEQLGIREEECWREKTSNTPYLFLTNGTASISSIDGSQIFPPGFVQLQADRFRYTHAKAATEAMGKSWRALREAELYKLQQERRKAEASQVVTLK